MNPPIQEKQPKFKTILLGKSTVGKTSIAIRIAYDRFEEGSCATIGASFITAHRGKDIKYDIWDTGGQERFRCLMPMYIRDSRITIFVFDVDDINTLNELNKYDLEINTHIIIVGNKTDLLDDVRLKLTVTEAHARLNDYKFFDRVRGVIFVSAKTGENFDSLLYSLNQCAKLCKNEDDTRVYPIKLTQPGTNESAAVTIEGYSCSC